MKLNRRGSTMIEGALVFTVFMLLVMGTLEFGRFMYAYNFVAHAAREGARYASVHASTLEVNSGQLTNVAKAWATGLDNTKVSTTYTCTDSCAAGKTVQVIVKYTYVPMVGNFILPSGNLTLSGSSSSVIFQ